MITRLRQPSLTRRIVAAFLVGYAAFLLALLLILVVALAYDASPDDGLSDDIGVAGEVVAYLAAPDVHLRQGKLAFTPSPRLKEIATANPSLWIVINHDRGHLIYGRPPSSAAFLSGLPAGVREVWARLPGSVQGRGDVAVRTFDSPAGLVRIAAGGVDPSTISWRTWLIYTERSSLAYAAPGFALLGMLPLIFIVPFVLRAVRPLARAVESVGPDVLELRLPEQRTPAELLPIVRAFNAALDRLADAAARQRRFIANVSHELRTPVAVLTLQAEALPDSEAKAQLRQGLHHLSELIGQLIDVERMAAGGGQIEAVDVVQLARAAVADITPLAIDAGYDVGFDSAAPSVMIQGDRWALSRAIANLLANAIAHGGRSGTIQASVLADGAIEIADEGPGVSPDARERIFEPFCRERTDRDGSGLGLHLVREVAHAHGGDVVLLDGAGSGTRFRLTLPPLHDGAGRR